MKTSIIKSTMIIGSGRIAGLLSGAIRYKAIAVLLGPSGVGLFGLLQSIMTTAGSLAGMGMSNSGIREIAAANETGSAARLSIHRSALRISSMVLAVLGALLVIAFRTPIATLTTGNPRDAWMIVWIGIGLFASTISGSQVAFLNGLRRMKDIALINGVSAVLAMLIGVAAIWQWRERGIVVAVLTVPLFSLFMSTWLNMRIATEPLSKPQAALLESIGSLFKFGFYLMLASFVTMGTQYLVRVIITKSLDIAATGHYQAVWNISSVYVGSALGAMITDYYPRLSASVNSREQTNTIINEQMEMSLLIAGPLIVALGVVAPIVLKVLFSGEFIDAVPLLRWQIMGDIIKVASWALGFYLLAQGFGRMHLLTQLAWNTAYVVIILCGVSRFGLEIAGPAYVASHLFLFLLYWGILRRMLSYRWQRFNAVFMLILVGSAGLLLLVSRYQEALTLMLGGVVVAILMVYSVRKLRAVLGSEARSRVLFGKRR